MRTQDISPHSSRYTFGHSFTAAERLRIIAGFFNPLAAEIIMHYTKGNVINAADMGCGPGYTTHMLARSTRSENTVGIDNSSYFLELAKKNFPSYSFIQDDVTSLKNKRQFEFIYCRFLLSHLNNVPAVIEQWIKMLLPNGILFIDELEGIETDVPVFREYLDISRRLIASQGPDLYIGTRLTAFAAGFKCLENRSDRVPVADATAAAWFYPNTISIWRDDPFVKENIPEKERVRISENLLHISRQKMTTSDITWKMKRILLTTKTL
jgi:trans-aconitate 2-methyltransferase